MKEMKKTLFTLCTVFMLADLNAQSVQEGINHLYANRYKSAVQVFQKMLATNPNLIEATYWLGQAYLDMDEEESARQLYDKALAANGNAPLIMAGKGHVLLLVDKKKEEARQMFESAITISRTKKGDDPVVLNAIGRASADGKDGNLEYAVKILEQALQLAPKNADIALNLGNAYRKKDPGQGGGKAYEMYKLATQINPNFAYPYVRIAKLFETQKQWDLVLENLNKAVQVDPSFSLAYYELFFYYFFNQKYDDATNYLNKYVASRPGEDHMEDDYLNSQLCWATKDWDCAISKAEAVKAAMGSKPKPRVFRQLAYSYSGKGDLVSARKNIDEFFLVTKDPPIPGDYELKANIYQGGGASCEDIYALYMQGATADSVLQNKIDFMTKAADFFKTKKCTKQEADMRMAIYNTRKNPNLGGLSTLGYLYAQAGEYKMADSLFLVYNLNFPDSILGFYWRGRINYTLDTTMTVSPFFTNMIENYQKTLEIALKDKIRFKTHGMSASKALVAYYANIRSSRDSALLYVYKGLEIDSTDAPLKDAKVKLEKTGNSKPEQKSPAKTGTKPVSSIRKPSDKA